MYKKAINIKNKIKKFDKKIYVDGDKSISIRWALFSSQAIGKSVAHNFPKSEDVINTLKCLQRLGIKIKFKNKNCEIIGRGINGFNYKKNIVLNAGNSGTLGRLILSLLIKSPYKIKITGDKSLSKRDFSRVVNPLKRIGANFYPKNKEKLPIFIKGSELLRPINYFEERGSAQCKSCVMLASLNTPSEIVIKAKKSRNHTENIFNFLKIPIKIRKNKKFDFIRVKKPKLIQSFNVKIPGDISSSAFFIVLTLLSKNSKIIIKNVNVNSTRIGVIKILNKMGAKIKLKNIKYKYGEKCADIFVKSRKNLKSINCPTNLNSSAIDEFLIIFLCAAKAKGVSYFKDISELNQKESPRLEIGSQILKMRGIKVKVNDNSIKIYGNPNLDLRKKYVVKNNLQDHRVLMMSVIAALSFGGDWRIFNPSSVNTSFPSFFKLIRYLGGNLN